MFCIFLFALTTSHIFNWCYDSRFDSNLRLHVRKPTSLKNLGLRIGVIFIQATEKVLPPILKDIKILSKHTLMQNCIKKKTYVII